MVYQTACGLRAMVSRVAVTAKGGNGMKTETIMPFAVMQSFYRALFFDLAQRIPSGFYESDLDYLFSRYEKEGSAFLFTTLPLLGKAVEKALILEDKIEIPLGWRLKRGTRLPVFLNCIFTILFFEDGSLRSSFLGEPSKEAYDALFFIRQICGLFGKVETQASPQKDLEALKGFRDRSTRSWDPPFKNEVFREVITQSRKTLEKMFSGDHPILTQLREFQKNPWGRHGPGAVAMSECGGEKWAHYWWPGLPDNLFEWSQGNFVKGGHPLLSQPSARAVTVPKDFRGPRVICIEPKENQFAQQGLMEILYAYVQAHPFTRNAISFENVGPSKRLCFENFYSTIDLKDASDTINIGLARLILPKWLFALVTRYRSRQVSSVLLDETWRTTCLASMGNATCFPLETLIFWAIAQTAIFILWKRLPYRWKDTVNRKLRVFGDDIIVPSWACDFVVECLETCGLVINSEKTCHLSLVKESCGEWTYNNRSICIVKCKSTHVKDHRSWLQFRDYAEQFENNNCHATAVFMEDLCSGKYPEESFKIRFNRSTHCKEIRIPQYVTKGKRSRLDDYAGLYAWYVRNDVTPYLHGSRKLVKWRWIPYSTFTKVR